MKNKISVLVSTGKPVIFGSKIFIALRLYVNSRGLSRLFTACTSGTLQSTQPTLISYFGTPLTTTEKSTVSGSKGFSTMLRLSMSLAITVLFSSSFLLSDARESSETSFSSVSSHPESSVAGTKKYDKDESIIIDATIDSRILTNPFFLFKLSAILIPFTKAYRCQPITVTSSFTTSLFSSAALSVMNFGRLRVSKDGVHW